MNLQRALYKSKIDRVAGDPAGRAAQRVTLQDVTVPTTGVEVALCGIALSEWFGDRGSVALYDVVSQSGGELRLRLIVANSCGVDGSPPAFQIAFDRGLILAPGVPVTLEFGTGSGPLGSVFCLLGHMVNPGDDCRFSASITIDRAGGGVYVVPGEGTKV